jgi:hypothetical protein
MAISRLVSSTRRKVVGAVVALSAALALGGIALATPASAVVVVYGTVTFTDSEEETNDVSRGVFECLKKYPETQHAGIQNIFKALRGDSWTVTYNCTS